MTRFIFRLSAVDGAPSVQPDCRQDQRAQNELHPIGIDLGQHHAVLDEPIRKTANIVPSTEI